MCFKQIKKRLIRNYLAIPVFILKLNVPPEFQYNIVINLKFWSVMILISMLVFTQVAQKDLFE